MSDAFESLFRLGYLYTPESLFRLGYLLPPWMEKDRDDAIAKVTRYG